MLGPHGVDTLGKLLRLLEIGQLALHPDGVAVGGIRDGAVDGAVAAALEAIVALARTRGVPVKVDIGAENALGNGARLVVALALGASGVLLNQAVLVGQGRSLDGVDDGLVEALEVGLLQPVVLNGLELVARLAGQLGGDHEVVEGLEAGVRGAEDEGVVAGVDVCAEEGGGLGVGAGDGDEVGAHDVGLGADGDEAVDVLLNGDKDLAGHVSALLGARGLILNVDAGGALLDEELGELHDGRETAVARVGVGDDGSQVVDVGELGASLFGDAQAFLALFPVVKELGHEQVGDLVRHSGLSREVSQGNLLGEWSYEGQ